MQKGVNIDRKVVFTDIQSNKRTDSSFHLKTLKPPQD
jgi:hypothetical protein